MRHFTSFSAFKAKFDQDEKKNLRRLAFEVEAESPRESFDTYLMPQQCDLMVVIEGSDTCIEHPLYVVIITFRLFGTCHSWLAASPPMASGDVGTTGTLHAFWRYSCSACWNFEYKSDEGWLDKASRGPTGAESVS